MEECMNELHIIKGDGTVHKTNVTTLARQISIELKKEGDTKIINTVFDAVENLMGGSDD
jgi:hypothetical protein